MNTEAGGDPIGHAISSMNVLPSLEDWRTAQDFARQTVRRAILRGDLPGGTRLIQADLAAQLGVSTTPVREALRDLAAAGLITLDRHRGGVVRALDWQEMEEIRQIQGQLRRLAVKKAVHGIRDEHLREADALAERMDEETDPADWADLNLQFHFLFFEATGGGRLTAILKNLEEATTLYVAQAQRGHPDFRRESNEVHRRIIAAYRAGDVDEVVAAVAAGGISMPLDATDQERPDNVGQRT